MNEAIALAEAVSGRRLEVEREPEAAGDVRRTKADVAKAGAELGWAPATPLHQGMHAQWDWAAAVESPA
jgi:UDP-glucose 4-epimerase